jgi:hypothetical protein
VNKLTTASIEDFARKHRLKIVTDPGDNTQIIIGREGHLFPYDHRLALMIIGEHGARSVSPRKWSNARDACERAGMEVLQSGEYEGALAFNPSDREMVKLAIATVGAKTKRTLSPEQRQKQVATLKAYRAGLFSASTPKQEGHLGA